MDASRITYLDRPSVEISSPIGRKWDDGDGQRLGAHPFLATLSSAKAEALIAAGAWRGVHAGDAEGSVAEEAPVFTLMLEGLLINAAQGSRLCIGIQGPGDVIGAEGIGDAEPVQDSWWFTDGLCFDIPAWEVANIVGEVEATRVLASALAEAHRRIGQEAICNASHSVSARLARSLVRMADLTGSDRLLVIQSDLADMLAIQRTSVNAAMRELQGKGILTVLRGRVSLLDLPRLRAEACRCADAERAQHLKPRAVATTAPRLSA